MSQDGSQNVVSTSAATKRCVARPWTLHTGHQHHAAATAQAWDSFILDGSHLSSTSTMPTSHPHTIPTAAIHPATAPSSPHRTINPLYQPPAHSLCSRVAVKALHEGSNLGELAQEVVDKCKLIHPSKVGPGTGEGREAGGRGEEEEEYGGRGATSKQLTGFQAPTPSSRLLVCVCTCVCMCVLKGRGREGLGKGLAWRGEGAAQAGGRGG